MFLLVPAQEKVGEFLATFKEGATGSGMLNQRKTKTGEPTGLRRL